MVSAAISTRRRVDGLLLRPIACPAAKSVHVEATISGRYIQFQAA